MPIIRYAVGTSKLRSETVGPFHLATRVDSTRGTGASAMADLQTPWIQLSVVERAYICRIHRSRSGPMIDLLVGWSTTLRCVRTYHIRPQRRLIHAWPTVCTVDLDYKNLYSQCMVTVNDIQIVTVVVSRRCHATFYLYSAQGGVDESTSTATPVSSLQRMKLFT